MTLEAEKEEANVTTCTFLVNDFPANILFNSRTNYSFVSHKFARGLALPADKLDSVLVVELTSLKFAPVSNCVENIVINLNGKKFHEELLPVKLNGFNIVLRIDWHSENDVEILLLD